MAEVGIAASIIGIATFGVKLTLTLYTFGTTASSAREQIDRIARNVALFSNILELLGERLNDDKPIHSEAALDFAEALYEDSKRLFERIEELLPDRRRESEELSFIQKIMWNFKKGKVDALMAELEQLKSSVNLLVQVLYAGVKIRSYNKDTIKSGNKRQAVNAQCMRVQNALVECVTASENYKHFQEEAMRRPALSMGQGSPSLPDKDNSVEKMVALSSKQNATLAAFEASVSASTNQRTLVLQKSSSWLQELLNKWTSLSDRGGQVSRKEANPAVAAGAQADSIRESAPGDTALRHAKSDMQHPQRTENWQARSTARISPSRQGFGAGEQEWKPKGILKPPRAVPFPEDPNPAREGVTPLKETGKKEIPPGARWTKISRQIVNPAALEAFHERFEESAEYVIVLRVLTIEEIEKIAALTTEIRGKWNIDPKIANTDSDAEAREREWQELHKNRRRDDSSNEEDHHVMTVEALPLQ